MSKPARSYRRIRKGHSRLGTPLMVRAQEPLLSALDRWIAFTGESISRPEAMRRLAGIALSSMQAPRGESERVA